jgi:hypothetical protein
MMAIAMESPQGMFQITRMALTHSILLEQIPFGQIRKVDHHFGCVILLHLTTRATSNDEN